MIDENNAIGVMHLGEYPNGFVFSTFVMSRYSYPLERMSVDDHRLLFAQQAAARARPTPRRLGGPPDPPRPSRDLVTDRAAYGPVPARAPPMAASASGSDSGGAISSWSDDLPAGATDLRALDTDTVIGTWKSSALPAALAASLRGYVEPYSGEVVFYFLRSV